MIAELILSQVWIDKSISMPNTYHILRNDGQQIKVTIDKGEIKAAWPLFQFEIDFINKYYNS
jgi:hypothetical protein